MVVKTGVGQVSGLVSEETDFHKSKLEVRNASVFKSAQAIKHFMLNGLRKYRWPGNVRQSQGALKFERMEITRESFSTASLSDSFRPGTVLCARTSTGQEWMNWLTFWVNRKSCRTGILPDGERLRSLHEILLDHILVDFDAQPRFL